PQPAVDGGLVPTVAAPSAAVGAPDRADDAPRGWTALVLAVVGAPVVVAEFCVAELPAAPIAEAFESLLCAAAPLAPGWSTRTLTLTFAGLCCAESAEAFAFPLWSAFWPFALPLPFEPFPVPFASLPFDAAFASCAWP